MARLIGPDEGSRKAEVVDPATLYFRAKRNKPATFYTDAQATQLADIVTLDGAVIAGSTVTTDAYSMIPLFRFPDGVDTLYVVCDNGPAWPVYARTDDRLDALGGRVGTVEGVAAAAETPAGAQAKADAAQAASAQRSANLSDLADATAALANLGITRKTTSGPPDTGTWAAGHLVVDIGAAWWLCNAGGTPGTWVTANLHGGYPTPATWPSPLLYPTGV